MNKMSLSLDDHWRVFFDIFTPAANHFNAIFHANITLEIVNPEKHEFRILNAESKPLDSFLNTIRVSGFVEGYLVVQTKEKIFQLRQD